LKEQATLSLKEISDLRQKLNNVDTSNSKSSILSTTIAAVSLPGQPNLPAHLLKPDTPLHVSQLGTNKHDASQPGTLLHLATPQSEVNKVTDINDNMAPNPNRFSHTNSSQDAEALDPDLPHSKKSTPSHTSLTDPESLCNNCHNKPENDDIDMVSEFVLTRPSSEDLSGYIIVFSVITEVIISIVDVNSRGLTGVLVGNLGNFVLRRVVLVRGYNIIKLISVDMIISTFFYSLPLLEMKSFYLFRRHILTLVGLELMVMALSSMSSSSRVRSSSG
jgi:hypothetical protein